MLQTQKSLFQVTVPPSPGWGHSPIRSLISVGTRREKPLVGLLGNIGSGKTSVAAILRTKERYAARSFAWCLKEIASTLMTPEASYVMFQRLEGPTTETLAALDAAVADESDWKKTVLPDGRTIRQFLIWLGDGARQFDPDAWIKQWQERVNSTRHAIVCPDVRYPNEFEAIEKNHGFNFFLMPKAPMSDSESRGSFSDVHASEQTATMLHAGYSLVASAKFPVMGCPGVIPIPRAPLSTVATQVHEIGTILTAGSTDLRPGYPLTIHGIKLERIN